MGIIFEADADIAAEPPRCAPFSRAAAAGSPVRQRRRDRPDAVHETSRPLMIAVAPSGATGRIRATVHGRLDLVTADQLRSEVLALLPGDGTGALELDLSRVGFCDMAGVRALVDAHTAAGRAGWRLTVTAAGPYPELLLTTLGVGELLGYAAASRTG